MIARHSAATSCCTRMQRSLAPPPFSAGRVAIRRSHERAVVGNHFWGQNCSCASSTKCRARKKQDAPDLTQDDLWSSAPRGILADTSPAFDATLKLLDWRSVCEDLSTFASTFVGKRACRSLDVPGSESSTRRLLLETKSFLALEYDCAVTLDFGGISSEEAGGCISRASKGGMCSSSQLRGLITVVTGADRIKKQILVAARELDGRDSRSGPLGPLLSVVSDIKPLPNLVRDVMSCVDEEGNVLEGASEQVRTTRGRVRALVNRLTSMLKGYSGEVSEKSGRMCVACPSGTKINSGVMLGSSTGGGIVYIEPPAVVALNNELLAARAEALAAEENVLWDLTAKVMGLMEEVKQCFDVVVWLDVLSAKVRYGQWLEGLLPELVPWDKVFHERGGRARGSQDRGDEYFSSPDDGFTLNLRGLRHPLLYGQYLKEKQQLERQLSHLGASGSGASGKGVPASRRNLSTRRENMFRELGLGTEKGNGEAAGSQEEQNEKEALQARLASLQPPKPIDILVAPTTHVVVITGPNTGGKTVAMKALGLAVCMAKCGIPIPVSSRSPLLPCFSSVLADIGDEQSLTANLSTFSGHLKRIQALRAEADGRSLILLDELGTGTDPTEGAALGLALLKKLVQGGVGNGALTIATTHHSVMTGLKFQDPRFENASVEFNEEALAPTYKLLWGVPGRSNALNIALRLGMDEDVVEAARTRLGSSVVSINDAISELERLKVAMEMAEAADGAVRWELERLTRKVELLKEQVTKIQGELSKTRSDLLFKVVTEAREQLKMIKRERKLYRQGRLPQEQQGTGLQRDGNGAGSTTEDVWSFWEAAAAAATAAEKDNPEGGDDRRVANVENVHPEVLRAWRMTLAGMDSSDDEEGTIAGSSRKMSPDEKKMVDAIDRIENAMVRLEEQEQEAALRSQLAQLEQEERELQQLSPMIEMLEMEEDIAVAGSNNDSSYEGSVGVGSDGPMINTASDTSREGEDGVLDDLLIALEEGTDDEALINMQKLLQQEQEKLLQREQKRAERLRQKKDEMERDMEKKTKTGKDTKPTKSRVRSDVLGAWADLAGRK